MQEIERKFLVTSEAYKSEAHRSEKIAQGYLCRDPERSVRIRTKGNKGYLTIKGKSTDGGVSRFEWEKEIALDEAENLFKLCQSGTIEKTRHLVKAGDHTFEVDEFYGENEGLTVAEVELSTKEEDFKKPGWLGEEVTGKREYYNSQLSQVPYSAWKNKPS